MSWTERAVQLARLATALAATARARKGKRKVPLGGVYKDVRVEEAKEQFFLLLELSALKL